MKMNEQRTEIGRCYYTVYYTLPDWAWSGLAELGLNLLTRAGYGHTRPFGYLIQIEGSDPPHRHSELIV
jgi:hypothetical protein